jgi:hypothetical protein
MAQVSVQPFYSGRAYYDVTSADGQKYVFVPKEFATKGFVQEGQQFYNPGFLQPDAFSKASAVTLPKDSGFNSAAQSLYKNPNEGYIWKAADFNAVNPNDFHTTSYYISNTAPAITGLVSNNGAPAYQTNAEPGADTTVLTGNGVFTNTTVTRSGGGGGDFFSNLFSGNIGAAFASLDPSTAISRELTNLYQPVEKAITAGVEDISKALSTDDAKKAMGIAAAYFLPGVGSALGQALVTQGIITGAAIPYATAIGTALVQAGTGVAQGQSFDTALTNATVNAVTSTGANSVAGYISKLGASPEVANAVTSVGASGLATAAKGGSAADIERNMTGALAGSTVTGLTGDKLSGAVVGGGVTGGTVGALTGAASTLGSDAAKAGATPTTTPTTQATLTPNLTDAQVSQIQNALGISVSDTTNNDVKLALGPLLAPLGAGAAIVSDSVIPLIGIFGAKAVSDTIDYFKNQNDSAGFYKWVNENMQAADDRVQNKQSLNPAGAGRGFVNPPVATTITPSQAAVTGTYGAGFSGAGGGAGAGVTAGEGTAGEQEARDFLAAQKVTHPEIDFATLAQEPALNESPADKKIADLIQPGAASTAATQPGTTPADRDILNLTGITQPTSTQPTAKLPAPVGIEGQATAAVNAPPIARPTAAVPNIPTRPTNQPVIDNFPGPTLTQPVATPGQVASTTPATFTPAIAPRLVPQTPTRPANQPVIDTFPGPTTTPADQAIIDLINPPATTPPGEPPPFVPPAVEPPVTTPPVVSEPPPDVTKPPVVEVVDPNIPAVDEPVVEDKPPVVDKPVIDDKPPPDDEKPPVDEVVEPEYKPEIFIYGGKEPPKRPRRDLSTTLQAPFYPSSTLGQALTGYRGAGEIEGKKTGKPRKNVWNEESLRLKDALGL